MVSSLLSVAGLTKSFKLNKILSLVDFKIYENEIVALIGESGSGKSTLIKILLGYFKADSGEITYKYRRIDKQRRIFSKIVGFVSQDNSFYENLTIVENLMFYSKMHKIPKKERNYRIKYLLNLVDLRLNRNVICNKLSGGMKRRLEFAIALIHDPKIIILDEPFTGLDVGLRNELWKVLEIIRTTGVTIIISTHLLSYVQKHCDRALLLNNKSIEMINSDSLRTIDLEEHVLKKTKKNDFHHNY